MSSARQNDADACAVHICRGIVAVLWLICAVAPARADDDTDTFVVSAHVVATCEIVADDLDFGDYNPVAASNLEADTTLSLTCTNGTPYNVGLNLGQGPGATTATRYMRNGAHTETLGYTLYRDSNRTLLWGVTQGTNTLAGTGTGSAVGIDVYGRVPMHQTAPVDDYSDTITVTVSW